MWCVSYLPGFLRLLFLLFFNIITKWAFKFIYSCSVVIIFIYFAFIHSQYLNIITIISIQIRDVQKRRRNYKVNKSTNLCPWCFSIPPVLQRLLFLTEKFKLSLHTDADCSHRWLFSALNAPMHVFALRVWNCNLARKASSVRRSMEKSIRRKFKSWAWILSDAWNEFSCIIFIIRDRHSLILFLIIIFQLHSLCPMLYLTVYYTKRRTCTVQPIYVYSIKIINKWL